MKTSILAPWGISCVVLQLVNISSAFKVYLAGDSTMAKGNGNVVGWGLKLSELMSVEVINEAIGGRSARSYTVEGRFDEIAKMISPGDYVVIEFGHNDGGSLSAGKDNGRTDCPGTGALTCSSSLNGKQVTVQTFPTYMTNAGKLLAGRGAKVIFSSQTPNNVFESGQFVYQPNRFVGYTKDCARAVGAGATYVDHGAYTAKAYKELGMGTTNSLFQKGDHTHTTAEGAAVVAKAFAKALVCSKNPLASSVKNTTVGNCQV